MTELQQELIDYISDNSGIDDNSIMELLKSIQNYVVSQLQKRQKVNIPGIGEFYVKKQRKRGLTTGFKINGTLRSSVRDGLYITNNITDHTELVHTLLYHRKAI